MALGKAFIEIHADTRPFAREIGHELSRILNKVERDVGRKAGERLGEGVADGAATGIGRSRKKVGAAIGTALEGAESNFEKFSKSIIDTIDDGLSGLPAEVKAVLGVALLAVAPALGALLAAAISAALSIGLTGGLVGLGAIVASQFDSVQAVAAGSLNRLRDFLLDVGSVFVGPAIAGIEMFERRIMGLRPEFERLAAAGAEVFIPFLDAVAGFGESFLRSAIPAVEGLIDLMPIMQGGFRDIGTAIGTVFTLIATDDDAKAALTDLLIFIKDMVLFTGFLVKVFLDLYGVLRQIAMFVDDWTIIGLLFDLNTKVSEFSSNETAAASAAAKLSGEVDKTTSALGVQEEAVKQANTIIQDYVDKIFNAQRSNISFEQSLDDMAEALRRNGTTLDINTQKGRDNQLAILDAAEALRQQRDRTIALTGDTAAANATFAANRKRLEDQAVAAGISRERFRELTNAVLSVPPPKETGVSQQSVSRAERLLNLLSGVTRLGRRIPKPGGGAGIPGYARGDVVTRPTLATIAEKGPEAVIPLNNPRRAATVMQQAGLTGSGSPNVNVYIGNQQIDAYIDARVSKQMMATARTMAYGTRG